MSSFLASYGQWALAATGIASLYFVITATFFELEGRRPFPLRRARVKFFRWWRHELTAAPVMLDLCMAVVLLPGTLFILFSFSVLDAESRSLASQWYYAAGFTSIVVVTVWRADAMMRAKARERRRAAGEAREKERDEER